MGSIYKITCIKSSKIYVGSTKRNPAQRMKEHFRRLRNQSHSNVILTSEWRKYGEESFVFDVIEVCDDEILSQREDHYIRILSSLAPNGFNCQTADRPVMTDVTRSKMSKSKTGELNSFYGKKHSEASRARMSNSLKGMRLTDAHRDSIRISVTGDRNPFYGKTHSEETKKKISEKGRARTTSVETRLKQSQALIGRHRDDATRERMSAAARLRWDKVRESRANSPETDLDTGCRDTATPEGVACPEQEVN